MDQKELERLAAILEYKENGYRDSAVTEAVELRQIIRQARPDLYELMLAEDQREAENFQTKDLAQVAQEPFQLDSALPQYPKLPYKLVNTITITPDNQEFVYHARMYNLQIEDNKHLTGSVSLAKYARENVMKRRIKFFPPGICYEEGYKDEKLWSLYLGNDYTERLFYSGKKSYHEKLISKARKVLNINLPQYLVTTVFAPMEEKLEKICSQIELLNKQITSSA